MREDVKKLHQVGAEEKQASARWTKTEVFWRIFILINVLLVAGLVMYILSLNISPSGELLQSTNQETEIDDNLTDQTEQQVQAMIQEADDSMTQIYNILIQGARADLGDGMVMSFNTDGSYDGFLDLKNPDISKGTYVVSQVGDGKKPEYVVSIYDQNKVTHVQYMLLFDSDYNMQLYYPETDDYYPLDF